MACLITGRQWELNNKPGVREPSSLGMFRRTEGQWIEGVKAGVKGQGVA